MPRRRNRVDDDDEEEEEEEEKEEEEEGEEEEDNKGGRRDEEEEEEEEEKRSDDEGSKAKRKRTLKKQSLAEGGESGESDGEDEYVPSGKKKTKAKAKASKKSESEASESEESDDETEFKYKYNSETLLGDEADKEFIASLNERERELELARRWEEYESAEKRWKIAQELKKKKRAESGKEPKKHSSLDSSSARRRSTRDRERMSKAIDELKNRKRANKGRVRRHSDDEDEEADDAGSDRNDERDADYKGESSDDGGKNERRTVSYSDEEEDEADSRPASYKDLLSIRLSRHKLERWVHERFFRDLVLGCFVRIGIGQHEGRSVYRVAQIIDVKETRAYSFGTTKSNLALVLKHGVNERPFRMEFVSNSDFTENEYTRWRDEMLDNELKIPAISHVQKKLKDIEEAKHHVFSSEDVKFSIESKKKFNIAQTNPALRREDALRKVIILREQGNDEAAREAEAEVDQLEEEAREKKERARTKSIMGVHSINQRNRSRNIDMLNEKAMFPEKADVFTRRRTTPSLAAAPVLSQAEGEQKAAEKVATAAAAAAAEAVAAAAAAVVPVAPEKPTHSDIHKKLDIALDIDFSVLSKPAPVVAASSASSKAATEAKPRGRGLDLAAYKKARGLI